MNDKKSQTFSMFIIKKQKIKTITKRQPCDILLLSVNSFPVYEE